MEQYLTPYFAAEKQEALLFMAVGVGALALSAWLWLRDGSYKGMLYPLVAIAAIQVTVGSTVYSRTDAQVAALMLKARSDPAAFRAEETQRMQVVIKNFVIYRTIEIALLLAGLLLMLVMRSHAFWHAFGIGLSIQSSLMLLLDYFAEARAAEYLLFVTGALG